MTLNIILWKCTGGYKLSKPQEKINHQKNMVNTEDVHIL